MKTSEQDKDYYIYRIFFQHDDMKCYIGVSSNPKVRLQHHLSPSKLRSRTQKNNWLKKNIAEGRKPEIEILAKGHSGNIFQLEIEYIQKYKMDGYILTNSTDGGEGMLNPSLATREKLSRASKGRCIPLHVLEKRSERMLGKNNPMYGIRGRQPMLGKNHSVETRKLISSATKGERNPFYGKRHSDSTKAKIASCRTKDYLVTSPEGVEYKVNGLKDFCIEKGLSYNSMHSLLSGRRKNIKGWKIQRVDKNE